MNKKEIKDWVSAIKQLEEFYASVVERQKPVTSLLCGLCRVAQGSCVDCLWWMFEGKTCTTYAEQKFDNSVIKLRTEWNVAWAEHRLEMLARWSLKVARSNLFLLLLYKIWKW